MGKELGVRTVGTVAASVLVALGAAPAASFPVPGPTMTIVGSRTAYATITVTDDTHYNLHEARATYAGGRWGGFLIGRDTSDPHGKYRDWLTLWTSADDVRSAGRASGATFRGHPTQSVRHRPGGWGVLTPGRYRIYLFTDGQEVTITLPWSAGDVTVTPDRPFAARVEAEQVLAPGFGVPTLLTMPLDGTRRSVTEAAAVLTAPPSEELAGAVSYDWACYARVGLPATPKSCVYDQQVYSSSSSNGWGRDSRLRRMYGSTAGREWRVYAGPTTTAVLTVMTVRYDP